MSDAAPDSFSRAAFVDRQYDLADLRDCKRTDTAAGSQTVARHNRPAVLLRFRLLEQRRANRRGSCHTRCLVRADDPLRSGARADSHSIRRDRSWPCRLCKQIGGGGAVVRLGGLLFIAPVCYDRGRCPSAFHAARRTQRSCRVAAVRLRLRLRGNDYD